MRDGHERGVTLTGVRLSAAARSVWAKSPDETGAWLPLWQHMDDSAAVAGRLFDEWLAPSVRGLLAADLSGDVEQARAAVTFLAGVHDLGKATPAFAIQSEVLADRMRSHELYMPVHKSELASRHLAHHSVAGHHLLIRWLVARGWSKRAARQWGVVLGGHHGVPPDSVGEAAARPQEVPELYGSDRWVAAQAELTEWVAARTGADRWISDWKAAVLSEQFQVLATALVIMSDWIASNAELFPFHVGVLSDSTPDGSRAENALGALALPTPWSARPPQCDETLFSTRFTLPPGAEPRPVQRLTCEVARAMPEPGLLLVEAPMGEGKTEAALAAAEIMASRWQLGGLFVGLPTQATTDAMFARVMTWLDAMGAEDRTVGGAVTLNHGKARFNRIFQGLVREGRLAEIGRDERTSGGDGFRRPAHTVTAHSWLSGGKKGQLANFTVGTIDQLLFAGLKARHLMLRHLGLAGKVVVLDEIHAYDAYMSSFMTAVMKWLAAYRVPVIALSATLPSSQRRSLMEAYHEGLAGAAGDLAPLSGDIGYPVLTWSEGRRVRSRVADPSGRHTSVELHALGDDLDHMVAMLAERLADGGCALVVRNTVRRVLEAAEVLSAKFPGEVTVAHARFIAADRLAKDETLLDRFGHPLRAMARPGRAIVVASQVVEQSLDLDFDLLVTDLAPVDLVLQRMGRLHRHQRGELQAERPETLRSARAYITGVDFGQAPPDLEQGAARVYDDYSLLRSAAVLRDRLGRQVELPDDIAPLVQAAYGSGTVGPTDWHEAIAGAGDRCAETTARRHAKAQDFQLLPPGKPGRAIIGWLAANVGEVDENSPVTQGHVRDGAPSLEAMLVVDCGDGRWQTPGWLAGSDAGLSVPQDEVPSSSTAQVMAQCSIRLPLMFSNADAEEALWSSTPPAWEDSPLIYRLPLLLVNADGYGQVGERPFRYSPERGLEVLDRDS